MFPRPLKLTCLGAAHLHLVACVTLPTLPRQPRSRFATAFSPPRHRTSRAAAAFHPRPKRDSGAVDIVDAFTARARTKSSLPDETRADPRRPPPPSPPVVPYFAQNVNGDGAETEISRGDGDGSASHRGESPLSSGGGGMDAYDQQRRDFSAVASEARSGPFSMKTTTSSTEGSSAPTSAQSFSDTPISSIDARVLESILQEGKLDLSTEEQVKKLLEGPRLQEGEGNPTVAAAVEGEGDGKYSSKFISAVSDNAFWNSLKAKASEIFDSVGIYIENRIERDTQTLAAVGLFAIDRIQRDIGRALPAAGRQARRLLLATNSSYAARLLDATDSTPFALPSERSLTDRELMDGYDDLYEELSTPADEIRRVTEAIKDILSGKDLPDSSRGVRSFAPAGTQRAAERQRRAYRARKQTVLKREREGIDRRMGRAIGSASTLTWELKREMQTDRGREAGYRSKGVRKALAAGAVQLLEAGREGSKRLLGGDRRRKLIGDNRDMVGIFEAGVVGDSPNVFDVSPVEEEDIIQDVIEEANMEYAPDGLLSPPSFIEEKRRLVASLESCLSQPSTTWLTKEVVALAAESGITLDGTVLREVITTMVIIRDSSQNEIEDIEAGLVELSMEYVGKELRKMKEVIDSVASVAVSAAGESAALLLKQELEGFVLSNSLDDIIDIELERMEQLLAERVAAREEEIRAQREQQQQQQHQQRQREAIVEPESFVTSAAAQVTNLKVPGQMASSQPFGGVFAEVEVVSTSPVSSDDLSEEPMGQWGGEAGRRVEVVSDSEYSRYEQQLKSAQSESSGDDVEVMKGQENPAAELILRVVDIFFFVGEKLFLVLLPDLITGGAKISPRYTRAMNRGRGAMGWRPLRNAKMKNTR